MLEHVIEHDDVLAHGLRGVGGETRAAHVDAEPRAADRHRGRRAVEAPRAETALGGGRHEVANVAADIQQMRARRRAGGDEEFERGGVEPMPPPVLGGHDGVFEVRRVLGKTFAAVSLRR